jgi:hypothetical protein
MSRASGNSPAGEGGAERALAVTEIAPLREKLLHGHQVFYRSAGEGPVVVLVHGITSTSATWET